MKETDEVMLVLLCSRTSLDTIQVKQINEILSRHLNWNFVIDVSNRNGVLALVCWNLLKKFSAPLPKEIKSQLSHIFQEHTQRNMLLTHKLIEIIRILETAGISSLPFKGTTLAIQAYKNLSLRQYSDLDILIQPKFFDEAVKILSATGYQPISKINFLKRRLLFLHNQKDICLVGENNFVRIELHWKLSGSHFAVPFEINSLWNRLIKMNLGGKEISVLAFNDLFVYLCLHGSRHGWEKLAWICDLHELILRKSEENEKIDWIAIQKHAKNHGCEKVVELGLFLIHGFFKLEIDYPNFELIKNNLTYQKIFEQVKKKNFSENQLSNDISDWYLYHLSLKEKGYDKFKLHLRYFFWYLRIIFRPNEIDRSVFHLPSALYPLYFILRPFRLLFTYSVLDSGKKIDKKI